MLEAIVIGVLFLAGGILALVGLIALPFLLLGGILKLLFFVILLPLRLLGVLFGVLFGVSLVVFKLLGFLLLMALGVVIGPLVRVAMPLTPLILLALAVWMMFRLFGRRSAYSSPS
jgi:hypothetical protein